MRNKIQLSRMATHVLMNISIWPHLIFLMWYMVNNSKREVTRSQRVLYLHCGGFNIPFNGLWSLAKKSLQWSVPLIYRFPSNCTYNIISWLNSNGTAITKPYMYKFAFVNLFKKCLQGLLLFDYSSMVICCYNRFRYQSIFYFRTRPRNVAVWNPFLFLLLLVLMWFILKTQKQNSE